MQFHDRLQKRLQAFDVWMGRPYGQLIWQQQADQVSRLLKLYCVDELVQLGGTPLFTLACATNLHFVHIDPRVRPGMVGHRVSADFSCLPLASDSVDMLLCVHMHEVVLDADRLFQELYRLVKPEGHVVVFSINRGSLWGLIKLIRGQKEVSWCLDLPRAHRAIKRSQFKLVAQHGICFRPPANSRQRLRQMSFFEGIGQLCWPQCGTVKMTVLKKQQQAALPMREAVIRPCP